MRKEFEMTQDQLDALLKSSSPVPMILLQCGKPSSPQERANAAWSALGKELGFDHMTVKPTGRGNEFFTAEVLV
jgi:hypothetical protein